MAKIMLEPGRTFGEFVLLPGHTREDCVLENINLEARLGSKSRKDLKLKIPLLSAAMTSVTGYEMALALGQEGGLGVLPARLSIEEQADIVKRIKSFKRHFVEDPVDVRNNAKIEEVIRMVDKYGHSDIPVVNRDNVFQGMFDYQLYLKTNPGPQDPVTSSMVPFTKKAGILYTNNPGISVEEARRMLEKNGKKYLVVLDKHDRLRKLAFRQDAEKIQVASAISTHSGWKERVKANIDSGVDMIVIDTSDAHNDFTSKVIREYKSLGMTAPLCVGNVVTYEGAMFLMKSGADIVKVGMSSGSICITAREKAVGRAPMTALMEVARARKDYNSQNKRYVPVVADGGISGSGDMVIALTVSDAVMMGGYFNHFFEARGEKLDEAGKETTDETKMRWVATWGEGSERAKNLMRYGHSSSRTFFPEGIEGRVPYKGMLKPTLRKDLLRIKAAMSNAGCRTLDELRERAVIELNSSYSNEIIKSAHDVSQIKE